MVKRIYMKVSIIIPTFNEAENIVNLIEYLRQAGATNDVEIIVSDGGSNDDTLKLAGDAKAMAYSAPAKGRATQMNYGVSRASGDVYYFVHADTRPPASFYQDIQSSLTRRYNCGSFRFKFDSNRGLRRVNSFLTRFNFLFFRGGDQSIFITKELWDKIGPYDENMRIMEDYDFLRRLWQSGRFRLIPKSTIVSARKYANNSWLKVQIANLRVVRMYRKGASQQSMIDFYRAALNYRKNAL